VRRVVAACVVLLALTACGDTQRPEGIVERWLQSLDQGRAGTPEKYASDQVSEQVLPGFRTLDPGQFDLLEVGRGAPHKMGPAFQGQLDLAIPFRVVDTDGAERRGAAWVTEDGSRIALVRLNDPGAPLLSEGGPAIVATSSSIWLAGALAALAFTAVALLLMAFVRRSAGIELERT
jgi:hypothetical protein